MLVTHTKDLGHIIQAVHSISEKIGGVADITTAIAVAQLALKHRQNKNLRQRIIVFVGSPLSGQAAEEPTMVKLAKKLKKNNVAVDFVAFGDGIEEGPLNVLRTFSETASTGDNSYVINLTLDPTPLSDGRSRHYIAVPPDQLLLSDALISSAVLAADRGLPDELMGEAGPSGQGEGGGTTQFEFGVDPSLDPELAMVCNLVCVFSVLGLSHSCRLCVCQWKMSRHVKRQLCSQRLFQHQKHRHRKLPCLPSCQKLFPQIRRTKKRQRC